MKRIQQVKDIRDIKGMRSVGARCVPKVQRSGYLELYTFAREKDRLEKDLFALDKRKSGIQRRLGDINKWMEKLRGETAVGRSTGAVKSAPAGRVKMLSVKY